LVNTRVGSDASVRASANSFAKARPARRAGAPSRRCVDLERADAQPAGAAAYVGAAQQRLHARAQLRGS
jgi:hypothetical protein